MKRNRSSVRLVLSRETIRNLPTEQLHAAHGGIRTITWTKTATVSDHCTENNCVPETTACA